MFMHGFRYYHSATEVNANFAASRWITSHLVVLAGWQPLVAKSVCYHSSATPPRFVLHSYSMNRWYNVRVDISIRLATYDMVRLATYDMIHKHKLPSTIVRTVRFSDRLEEAQGTFYPKLVLQNWYLFACSCSAHFRPKSGILPTF